MDFPPSNFPAPLRPGLNIPPAPREPSRRARNLIFAYAGVQKYNLTFGIVFLGIGLLLSIPFCWGTPIDGVIALGHQEVQGTILSVQENMDIEILGEHLTTLAYSYRTNDGEFTGKSITQDTALLHATQPGATYPVQVSKVDARWSRLSGTTCSWTGYWGTFTLFFPIIGATIVGFSIRANRRAIRAFRYGQPTWAKVIRRGQHQEASWNDRHPIVIAWEFKVDDVVYMGSLSNMSLLAMDDLMNLDEIPVLYDPSNPAINTVFVP